MGSAGAPAQRCVRPCSSAAFVAVSYSSFLKSPPGHTAYWGAAGSIHTQHDYVILNIFDNFIICWKHFFKIQMSKPLSQPCSCNCWFLLTCLIPASLPVRNKTVNIYSIYIFKESTVLNVTFPCVGCVFPSTFFLLSDSEVPSASIPSSPCLL